MVIARPWAGYGKRLGFDAGSNPAWLRSGPIASRWPFTMQRGPLAAQHSARGNYNKHEGQIQRVEVRKISRQPRGGFGGLGRSRRRGLTAIPGASAMFHTADAIFQRRITGYAREARDSTSVGDHDDQLLERRSRIWHSLKRPTKSYAAETLEHGQQLAQTNGEFARTGPATEADANRATAALALLKTKSSVPRKLNRQLARASPQQLSSDPTVSSFRKTTLSPSTSCRSTRSAMGRLGATVYRIGRTGPPAGRLSVKQ